MQATTVTARAKAFSSEPVNEYKFQVEGKTVRVLDSIAGHFTLCHSLSQRQQQRIRRLAAQKSAAA